MSDLIKVKGLHFSYDQKKVLKGLSFSLRQGETLGIIGESGSGKTSLMKILAGKQAPLKGSISYETKVYEDPSAQLIPGHEKVKLVNQDFDLAPYLSVRNNMLKHSLSESDTSRKKLISYYEKQLELKRLSEHRAIDTSGGQKQRVALATALGANPEVLLLDEPFSNLDYPLKHKMMSLLKSEWMPRAMVIVTHEPQDMLQMADRIIVMQKGKIIQKGTTEEVYQNPKSEYVARLLGPVNVLSQDEAKAFGANTDKELLVRPYGFKIAEKGVEVEVEACKFKGGHYELEVVIKSTGKKLSVYNDTPNVSTEARICLISG